MEKLSKEELKELELLTDQANLIIFEEKMRGEDIRLILVPVINELLNITTVPNHNINIYEGKNYFEIKYSKSPYYAGRRLSYNMVNKYYTEYFIKINKYLFDLSGIDIQINSSGEVIIYLKDSISQDIKNTIKDIIERYSDSINCKIQKIENGLYSYETAKRISECTKELQEKQLKYNDTIKMLSSILAYGNPFPN